MCARYSAAYDQWMLLRGFSSTTCTSLSSTVYHRRATVLVSMMQRSMAWIFGGFWSLRLRYSSAYSLTADVPLQWASLRIKRISAHSRECVVVHFKHGLTEQLWHWSMTTVHFVLNGVGAIDKKKHVVIHIFCSQLQFPYKMIILL
jgi:hypothetical protein